MDKALSLFNGHRHFWILARLGYSEQALADREGLTDFPIETDLSSALEAVGLIEEAAALRVRHPLITRPVGFGRHILLISRGRTGYLAFYSFDQDQDAVLILAIRHQREAGSWEQDKASVVPRFRGKI